jgi:hypothetical protein
MMWDFRLSGSMQEKRAMPAARVNAERLNSGMDHGRTGAGKSTEKQVAKQGTGRQFHPSFPPRVVCSRFRPGALKLVC